MAEVTNKLIYEVLKDMQRRITNIEDSIREVLQELLAVRAHMTAMLSDIANLYAGQAKIETRLDRIERRLDMVGQPAE
jgi:chromosome segregation ATPase